MRTPRFELSTASMKRETDQILFCQRILLLNQRGITLAEILMSLLILALAVLPAIGAFSKYYGTATRQLDQEVALKLGEAVINVLMTVNYRQLARGEITSIPLNIQLPSGAYSGTLDFDGKLATGTALHIGKANFGISSSIETVFRAQNILTPHADAMELNYFSKWPGPGGVPPGEIATYSCFDDLIAIKVVVNYGGGRPVELATFRADMSR